MSTVRVGGDSCCSLIRCRVLSACSASAATLAASLRSSSC